MPSDYGDDSGEKLVDWMLRIGQDAGGAAMSAGAERLANAFRNARGKVAGTPDAVAEELEGAPQWAKLSMAEFEQLPEYESIRQLIDEKLDRASIEHAFHNDGERGFLVFKVEDAPDVDEVFADLERKASEALDEAKERIAQPKSRDAERLAQPKSRDAERLAVKAEQAKAASAASKAAREQVRQVERLEQRAR